MSRIVETLRHETLAHFGLNILSPTEKAAFLRNIIKGKANKDIKALFEKIWNDYPEARNDEFKQAEEIITMTLKTNSNQTEQENLQDNLELDHYERVRQHCVEVFSLSPSHQARAAKNPNYWNELGTMGRWII